MGTHLQLYSSCLLSSIKSSSDGTNCNRLGSCWIWEWVSLTSGGEITKGSWGSREFVELSIEEPLESVSLLISDPALVVLVEVVPCALEMGIEVSWDFSWLKLVSGLKGGTGCDLSVILHEELLTGLVSRWGSTFFGVMAIDVIHDFIFVGSKFVKSFDQNGGLDGHARDRVSFLVKLLTDPEDAVKKIKVTAKSAKKVAAVKKEAKAEPA